MQIHQLDARARRMIQVLKEMIVRTSVPVEEIYAAVRGEETMQPFANGGTWGHDRAHDWMDFCVKAVIPQDFCGKAVLSIVTGREGQWEAVNPQFVVWVNGRIEQAFDTQHTALVLTEQAEPGREYDIFLQGYANCEWPNHGPRNLTPPQMLLRMNDVCADVEQLVYDLDVIYQAVLLENEGCRSRETALYVLSDALNLLDLRNPHSEAFHASIAAAREYLRVHYYEPLAELTPEAYADIVGHTHIDVAWLWDLYQTRHKAVRSFATMLSLMERYPEFKFMSSQAQLYQFVKEDQPELFERIREAVAQGRWEPEGGMWVEADCNVTGGESLVRQLLYGNEFFAKEFGRRSRILWLPDVFGYSAALPQILKKSGIDYFFTSKLSWSEYNLSPYDTFRWKGIDGSEVLTHFTPARDYAGGGTYEKHEDLAYFTTYNAMIAPMQVKGGWQRFQQKGVDNHFLVSYGYGDGGGGPTDWMIENARRMANPVQGIPAVRQVFPSEFFQSLEKRVEGNKRLPKWSGELYLEYHRGTYTAMARNKRSNRKTEIALRETELWREMARRETGLEYPNDALRSIWRRMLTLQFHDILPGSSIKKVYDDSAEMYAQLEGEIGALKAEAFAALGAKFGGDLLLYNSLSNRRDDLVYFDAPAAVTALRDAQGNCYPVQHLEKGACAFVRGLAPMGATPVWFVCGDAQDGAMHVTTVRFDTPYFSGEFDEAMRIVSLVDKRRGRELVKGGQALNRIVCYENRPHNYDAWDINIYYDERSWEVNELIGAQVVESGPVMTKIRCHYRFNRSEIVQHIVFYREIPRIDFETWVDWKEPHYLLKAHFPADIFANEATYDIQFGNVKRPTHRNTSWDAARFEVCAHKWMDISEGDYGLSLMNDCKYGHSADENGMALTLLKSSTEPNPDADQEEHVFTYSLLPHEGDWRSANTPRMAYQMNIPVTAAGGLGAAATQTPFVSADKENVIVETVKRALDGEETVIRLYECFGQRTRVTLTLGFEAKAVWTASMMEEKQAAAAFDGGVVELELKPYEIVTLMVK
ncbi:MAG: alpha-mannosidase [Clostridia bacterium]|nr:alpha-mannosidase [Clostridia bacterium]